MDIFFVFWDIFSKVLEESRKLNGIFVICMKSKDSAN
jgi:hypothetical protein